MTNKNYLLDTIFQLRTEEELVYYSFTASYSTQELQTVVDFLEEEYGNEILHYPYTAPPFDAAAAEWAAIMVFRAGLLFLNRNDEMNKVRQLITPFENLKPNDSQILSADLLLRFLPKIIAELANIDYEDPVVPLLESIMNQFAYSAIGMDKEIDETILEKIFESKCVKQLYVDRVLALKARNLATIPVVKTAVFEAMGNYQNIFWNNL